MNNADAFASIKFLQEELKRGKIILRNTQDRIDVITAHEKVDSSRANEKKECIERVKQMKQGRKDIETMIFDLEVIMYDGIKEAIHDWETDNMA